MKMLSKRIVSLLLALVMVCSLMPMTAMASESEGREENLWSGRSAVFVGDSITAGSGTTETYYQVLSQELSLGAVTAMGVSGSCISAASDYGQNNQPLINRYQNIPSADLIVIFMGTNDYGHETPLGSTEDTQDGTFYGALNVIVPALVEEHPSSKIVFVTPLHRYGFGTSKILGTQFTSDNLPNGVGAALGDYVEALKTVCANNGVSVIDLYNECTLDPADAGVRADYMPDGLHPNAAGHKLIAGIMKTHIRSYEPAEKEQETETELIYGNKFASAFSQENRASSRVNQYLKAGTVITLKDPDTFQWACVKTDDENSCSNLGYFPDGGWSDQETAVVAADGWVGFVLKYRDETQSFDLSKPLSDYITIEIPHTHVYEEGICTACGGELTFAGKTVSILSHSISTYAGVSNNTAYNSTIGNSDVYYTEGRHGVYQKDTWWQQVIDALDMELLVNNSWSGSCVFMPRKGEASVGYGDRAINLHNDHTGEEPNVILVYLGCNDFAYYKDNFGKAGDIDYSALIQDNGDGTFTYAEPESACEAYAIMLHKVGTRYPNAEIYCMTSTARRETDYTGDSYPDAGQPTEYSAQLQTIAVHFGYPVVDLENAIPKEVEIFDAYMGDKRAHPNALGMDQITNAVISVMLGKEAEICHVTSANGAVAEQAVLLGGSYSAEVAVQEGYALVVTMAGEDITDEVCRDGKITIAEVTGDVAIDAVISRDPLEFRWELKDGELVSVGTTENSLRKLSGTVVAGVLNDGRYELETSIVLKHNYPWVLEWKCAEDWRGVMLSSAAAPETGMTYMSRVNGGQLCFGIRTGEKYYNYGVDTSNLDDQTHAYRLENRISADGSNMVWLYVDGVEIGQMVNHYIGSTSQGTVSDWITGKDFVFSFIGIESHALRNCQLDYLAVTECAHTYKNGICTGCGATANPYLQQLPEDLVGCTNLYDVLTPVKGYYTATKYDTSNGAVLSVVIPVEPGDRIAASSFGSVSENMGSVDGIRVTYLRGEEIVTSLSAGEVYNGYTTDGYIIVPEGVDAVCIPWWKPSNNNWLTLSQISKGFAVHRSKAVSEQAPTCTESGYTAGEICEICSAPLSEREEIPPTGHTYSDRICTVCGAVDLNSILGGKYVSILGDSISTFNGYSNDATVNTTIGGNGPRYDAGAADTKPGSYCLLESVDQTWWMGFANRSGMKLLVNNSWAGSQVFGGQTSDGRVIPAAYLDRCVNLHDNTLENNPENAPVNPDVIFVYLGINDYNFNRSNVGTGVVDYAGLVNSDGTYVTPTSFGEAYGIMLHKMQAAYPDAQIFVMTLLPENLYSVDKVAWEQHNAYIRAAAGYYDLPVVDLAENCAITWENYSGYMIDKIHPTTEGMKLISDCIEAELQSYYKENLPHTHTYENGICTDCGAKNPNTVQTMSLRYDDHADMAGKTVEIIDAGTPTSYQVGYGVDENTVLDTAVVALEGDTLVAVGIGTAKVKIDGEIYEVTVTAAPISLLLLIGQSNMRGSEGNADQSIVCPDGMVYATFGDDRGDTEGIMNVNNATKFAASALTGTYSTINVEGTTEHLSYYPINSLTEAGNGTFGPDSGFAYEWVKQTGEKVWIVNAAHGGSSIKSWAEGATNFKEADLLFSACQETLRKEIAAGHFTLSHMGYFWCQGCSDYSWTAEEYVTKYLAMHDGLKKELSFDHDSNAATADKVLEFAGIIPVRAGHDYNDGYREGVYTDSTTQRFYESFLDLQMTGPRVAQYWMINNPELSDIWGVCNIGEDWVWMPDGTNGVVEYFQNHYPNGTVDYTTQVKQSASWYTPTTPKAVHDSIHYNQIGYNEIGREAARNALILLGEIEAPDVENEVEFLSWDGYSEVTVVDAYTEGRSETLVVPMVYPIWKSKDVTYTLTDGLIWDYYDLLVQDDGVGGTLSANNMAKVVSVTGHTWSDWETKYEASAEGPGLQQRVCSHCGKTDSRTVDGVWQIYDLAEHLLELPEDICHNTNLWDILPHENVHFTSGKKWGESSTPTTSITIPVNPGDQIYATSWNKAGENGHTTSDGIRLTFFDTKGIAQTLGPGESYRLFAANGGYLIAPEGTIAVNIVMWYDSEDYEVYILNRDHIYENGTCLGCGDYIGPVITQQPESAETAVGTKFAVTVKAEGDGLTYQWYYKDSYMKGFDVSVNKTSSYAYTMQSYMHNRQLYCVVTDRNGNQVTTDVATLTRPPMELTILAQPMDVEVSVGQKFTVKAVVQGDGLTYQWYYKDTGMRNFRESGNHSSAYAYTMQSYMHNRQVYCVITDMYGNQETTDVVTITRPPVELEILAQPMDVETPIGQRFSVSAVVQGDGLSYQWYYKDTGMSSFKQSGNRSACYSYTMQSYMHNRQVYCVITDMYGNQEATDIVTITRPPVELMILSQPEDVYAELGQKFSAKVKVQGDGLTYQWYYKDSYMKSFEVSVNRSSAYAYAMQSYMDNRQVYCVITDVYGNQVVTDVVTLILIAE